MLRRLLFISLLLVIARVLMMPAAADDCTERMNAYIDQLTALARSDQATQQEQEVAQKKLDTVKERRQTMTDCALRIWILSGESENDKGPSYDAITVEN